MTILPQTDWLQHGAIASLWQAFAAADTPLRLVGGCVRDALIGRPIRDKDCATPATPDQVIALLTAANIHVIPTGIAHGTVTAVIDHEPFEITTLRRDESCDGRHANVAFTDDWQIDASRRDFTMNALYCDAQGQVDDYVDGVTDAMAGRVRFIGDAHTRIAEDRLRVLRFFRFFATHGRGQADTEALAACRAAAQDLHALSGERIQQEMLKLLAAPQSVAALTAMRDCRIFEPVWPAHDYHFDAIECLTTYTQPLALHPLLRLCLMLRQLPQDTSSSVSALWRLSNRDRNLLHSLVNEPAIAPLSTPQDAAHLLYRFPQELALLLLLRDAAETVRSPMETGAAIERLTQMQVPVFPLSGRDLVTLGIVEGPSIGRLLSQLEQYWISQHFLPDQDALLEHARREGLIR